MNRRQAVITELKADGYQVFDDYPSAGITVMVKQGKSRDWYITVKKNGAASPGNHPPKH